MNSICRLRTRVPAADACVCVTLRPWSPTDWVATDDRVRGGSSQSYFECAPFEPTARFYGTLDIETLGGAGFASQRTTGDDREWDLSGFDGIEVEVVCALGMSLYPEYGFGD